MVNPSQAPVYHIITHHKIVRYKFCICHATMSTNLVGVVWTTDIVEDYGQWVRGGVRDLTLLGSYGRG